MPEKFLRTHNERVKIAEKHRKESLERINIIDREAFVEKYLLIDVKKMYEHRLRIAIANREKAKSPQSKKIYQSNVVLFAGIVDAYTELIDICEALIAAGRYKDVWKNIPETQIYYFSKNAKNVKIFQELTNKMYDDILDAGYKLEQERAQSEEERQYIDNKYANLRAVNRASFDGTVNVAESQDEFLETSTSYQEALFKYNNPDVSEGEESIIKQAKNKKNIKPNIN